MTFKDGGFQGERIGPVGERGRSRAHAGAGYCIAVCQEVGAARKTRVAIEYESFAKRSASHRGFSVRATHVRRMQIWAWRDADVRAFGRGPGIPRRGVPRRRPSAMRSARPAVPIRSPHAGSAHEDSIGNLVPWVSACDNAYGHRVRASSRIAHAPSTFPEKSCSAGLGSRSRGRSGAVA